MPILRESMGKVLIKNAVLRVPRWKKTQIFPHEAFCLFVVAGMYFEVALLLESYSVLETPGCTPVWPPWLVDKGNFWVLDQLEHSPSQWFYTVNSLYFEVYFSFTWYLESLYTDLLQFKHKCTYLSASSLKNKQYNRQEQS